MIERVTRVDAELVAAFARLVPQLATASPPPDEAALAALLAQPGMTLLIARDAATDEAPIVGATCVLVYRIVLGLRARIDDVVVDASVRGRGLGEALIREAIAIARAAGATSIHLTSAPSRDAANRLYQRLGFAPRATNVYQLKL